HWDHLGGIRAAMDEGATILTHQSNKAFLERVAKTPHTIAPDRLASSKKGVKIQTVGDDYKLTGGNNRVIELHRLQGYEHTGDATCFATGLAFALRTAFTFTGAGIFDDSSLTRDVMNVRGPCSSKSIRVWYSFTALTVP